MEKLNRWFELNWAWLFINGRKQEMWRQYLIKKYNNGKAV